MTEPSQQPPEPPEQPEQEAPEQAPESNVERSGEASGFMLYDLSELRFVGRRQSTRRKADDKSLKRAGHRYEVREV